jgi:hypothetical protein
VKSYYPHNHKCRLPTSAPQAVKPRLPEGGQSLGGKLYCGDPGGLTSGKDSQSPPTEGQLITQRKQIAGTP